MSAPPPRPVDDRPTFEPDSLGDVILRDVVIKGHMLAAKCGNTSCSSFIARRSADLLDRFWRQIDRPLRVILADAVCSTCRSRRLTFYSRAGQEHREPVTLPQLEAAKARLEARLLELARDR